MRKVCCLSIWLFSFFVSDTDATGIDYPTTCGSDLKIDTAEILFKTTYEDLVLYAINSNCYKCSKTLLSSYVAPTSPAVCAQVFTPHAWYLKLYNSTSAGESQEISRKIYTFLEHGVYEITVSSSFGIDIEVVSEPEDDSNLPLYILLAVLSFSLVIVRVAIEMSKKKKPEEVKKLSEDLSVKTTKYSQSHYDPNIFLMVSSPSLPLSTVPVPDRRLKPLVCRYTLQHSTSQPCYRAAAASPSTRSCCRSSSIAVVLFSQPSR